MESFFVRYRNFMVLLALLLVQIVGLAVQVHRDRCGHGTLDTGDGRGRATDPAVGQCAGRLRRSG